MTNPFATRRTRPGALDFLLPADVSLADLVERLRQAEWRGEIIGPHGTGKSTLLSALVPHLKAAGREVRQVTLGAGETGLPITEEEAAGWHARTLLVIDGYEQLSWPSRVWLQSSLAASGAGVLVTAHAAQGFPALWTTRVDPDLAWRIVSGLLARPVAGIDRAAVEKLLAIHHGNLREVLFALYDLFQSAASQADSRS